MVMAKEKKGTKASSFWLVFIPLSLVNFPCRVYMYASLSEIWLRDEKLFFPLLYSQRRVFIHIRSLTHMYTTIHFLFLKIKNFSLCFCLSFLTRQAPLGFKAHTHITRWIVCSKFRRSHSDFVFEQWQQSLSLLCVCDQKKFLSQWPFNMIFSLKMCRLIWETNYRKLLSSRMHFL